VNNPAVQLKKRIFQYLDFREWARRVPWNRGDWSTRMAPLWAFVSDYLLVFIVEELPSRAVSVLGFFLE